jgi:hypothetical protein
VTNKEEIPLTFSDEDFEKRYSSEDAAPSRPGADKGSHSTQPLGTPVARSRNRFMRALLRRRMSSSG